MKKTTIGMIYLGGIVFGVALTAAASVAAMTVTTNIPDTKVIGGITDERQTVSVIENKDDRCYVANNWNGTQSAISCVKISGGQQ